MFYTHLTRAGICRFDKKSKRVGQTEFDLAGIGSPKNKKDTSCVLFAFTLQRVTEAIRKKTPFYYRFDGKTVIFIFILEYKIRYG